MRAFIKKHLLFLSLLVIGCKEVNRPQQESDSGIRKASVKVHTDKDGHSVEQSNYIERVKRDNETGSIKHLYIVSAQTGTVLEYSTVKGKVTSGGKRLSPKTVFSGYQNAGNNNMVIS